MKLRNLTRITGSFALAVAILAGCQTPSGSPPPKQETKSDKPAAPPPESDVLRKNDMVTVEFRGTSNPPSAHQERIREDGTIRPSVLFPPVKAEGKSVLALQKDLQELYNRFYRNLTVTVHSESRLFYVYGEVKSAGRYPYSGELTVSKGITSAGGFTDFANKKRVQVTRANGQKFTVNCLRALKTPELDKQVYPGDEIHVPRRFF